MDEVEASGYWCHMCAQMVNPVMDMEIKCPFCESGFIEQVVNSRGGGGGGGRGEETDLGSERALSPWAQVFLGIVGGANGVGDWGGRRGRRRILRRESESEEDNDDDDDDVDDDDEAQQQREEEESELETDLESFLRRSRRTSSAAILHLLAGLQAGGGGGGGTESAAANSEVEREREQQQDHHRERERGEGGVILINPFNQAIILQGSFGLNNNQTRNQLLNHNQTSVPGSLGDYLIGPGLDLLLQHLAENDPNRYGTPPAKKEAVEAMPSVKVEENIQCSVCLEDFEIGTEAKEMPCKHKFHNGCILPWLELHSSCPVCRFQIPAASEDGPKSGEADDSSAGAAATGTGINGNTTTNNRVENNISVEAGEGENGIRPSWLPIPWPFNGLFSLSASQNDGNSPSPRRQPSSSSSSATAGLRNNTNHREEN